MATFALIHGGGGSAWDWHLVATELRERGHDPVAVDLPCEDPSAGWWNYADAVVEAIGERRELVVVGHSLGGFTAPLVCARMPVDLRVLVAAMIPSPGELFDDWWVSTGYEASGYDDVFYHDVPPDLASEASRRERDEAARALREPWPLEAWPEKPTKYLLCRDDLMENLIHPFYLRDNTLAACVDPATVLQMIAVQDIGQYGARAFTDASALNRREIDIAGDAVTMPQAAAILGDALGRPLSYVRRPIEDVRKESIDVAMMLEWFDRVGYNADIPALEREFRIRPTTLRDWAPQQR